MEEISCKSCTRRETCEEIHIQTNKLWCESFPSDETIYNIFCTPEAEKIIAIKNYVNQDQVEFPSNWISIGTIDSDKTFSFPETISIYDFSFVQDLTEDQRNCLLMRTEGLSYIKIASILGINIAIVYQQMSASLKKLKETGINETMFGVLYLKLNGISHRKIAKKLKTTKRVIDSTIDKLINLPISNFVITKDKIWRVQN